MAVLKKSRKGVIPPISTASLPDVIFMILFFFMVSTRMRDTEVLVSVRLPEAGEAHKLEKKQAVSYIYVGVPVGPRRAEWGAAPRIQLNDSYRRIGDIAAFIASEQDKLTEAGREGMTVMIKADRDTRMGVITDIKQELRRAGALRIVYAAADKE